MMLARICIEPDGLTYDAQVNAVCTSEPDAQVTSKSAFGIAPRWLIPEYPCLPEVKGPFYVVSACL